MHLPVAASACQATREKPKRLPKPSRRNDESDVLRLGKAFLRPALDCKECDLFRLLGDRLQGQPHQVAPSLSSPRVYGPLIQAQRSASSNLYSWEKKNIQPDLGIPLRLTSPHQVPSNPTSASYFSRIDTQIRHAFPFTPAYPSCLICITRGVVQHERDRNLDRTLDEHKWFVIQMVSLDWRDQME